MAVRSLEDVLQLSIRSLYKDVSQPTWLGREREIVSLFVFSHLLPLCSKGSIIADPGQIGIEVAVPQVKNGARVERDVCKDLVIWPQPKMTCWEKTRPYPLAVVEWKTLNINDKPRTRQQKLQEYELDICWLRDTSLLSSGFTGFAVLISQDPGNVEIECARVRQGEVECGWLSLKPTKERAHHA